MQDPKKQLKKAIKDTTFGIDPQKAIHSELTEHTDKMEETNQKLGEIKDEFKGSNAFKMGDFVASLLDHITPKRGRDYLPDEEMGGIKEELRPVKGKDYYTEEETQSLLEQATPKKGLDYFTEQEVSQIIDYVLEQATPVKGIDYSDGADGDPGKDAKPADEEKIARMVLKRIKVKNGKDAILPKMEDIAKATIKALKELPENEKLDISHLRNAGQLQSAIGKANYLKEGAGFKFNGTKYKLEELMHGGGSSSGGSTITPEIPTPAVNGSTTVFTVQHPPVWVLADGQGMTNGNGYALTGSGPYTLTMDNPPQGFLIAFYNS